jgi:hypothetical protein
VLEHGLRAQEAGRHGERRHAVGAELLGEAHGERLDAALHEVVQHAAAAAEQEVALAHRDDQPGAPAPA